jgi:GNAT superfamily N-acetyltransferase
MLIERRDDGFLLTDDPDRLDIETVHRWLATESYWAAGRTVAQMRAAVAGSETLGVYLDGRQVAFARIVTDAVVFAYLCDVFVDRSYRGRGLGSWLVRTVRDNLAGRGVRRLLLATRDAHGVYAPLGFAAADPGRWMECDPQATRAGLAS